MLPDRSWREPFLPHKAFFHSIFGGFLLDFSLTPQRPFVSLNRTS